jgi:hypothetical protein
MFTVIDNGIGIDIQDECKLFKPYATLEAARELHKEGAGLGLYVCRLLCTELEGKIFLTKRLENGKTGFTVEINVKYDLVALTKKEYELKERSKKTAKKPKIIFYDDSLYYFAALENILHEKLKLNKNAKIYQSGLTIARKILDSYNKVNYNQVALVVIDYKMSGLNACDLILWTREFLKDKEVKIQDYPVFVFREEGFKLLDKEKRKKLTALGINDLQVFEKVTDAKQMDA